MAVGFEIVDSYLLGEAISKADVVAALLAERSGVPGAAPFYRALEAVGARAADEAFVALRLVLAGRAPEDHAVRRLRALSSVARACAHGDATTLAATLRRDRAELGPLADGPASSAADRAQLRRAVAAAYERELEGELGGERNAERDLLR